MATKYSVEITDANFDELVIKSDKPVLVDFWAEWCGPCIALGPTIEELAQEYEGRFLVAKMDVDRNANVPMQFGIRNIPTMIFFKNGQPVDKVVGKGAKSVLVEKMNSLL
jgi:thioredoxin 1